MKCPHCGVEIHWIPVETALIKVSPQQKNEMSHVATCRWDTCPACGNLIIKFFGLGSGSYEIIIWPKHPYREPCPPEVPNDVATDYNEACAVIDISPTAAAALARRCMQYILERDAGAPRGGKLWKQVEVVVNDQNTPEHVKGNLHDLREIGNFSAHANEDVTGQVLRAEAEEAEWTLETLRTLFEHYYVGPARAKARKEALTAKLAKKAT